MTVAVPSAPAQTLDTATTATDNETNAVVQGTSVVFPWVPSTETYHLVEIPPSLIKLFESSAATNNSNNTDDNDNPDAAVAPPLVIRGGPNAEALLCTPTESYQCRLVSTSNTVLLLAPESEVNSEKPDSEAYAIEGSLGKYIELIPVLPNAKKALEELFMRVEEYDEVRPNVDGYTLDQILHCVSGSEREILEGLRSMDCVLIHGRFRKVSSAYLLDTLKLVLNTLISNDANVHFTNRNTIMQYLKLEGETGIEAPIVQHLLDKFADGITDADGDVEMDGFDLIQGEKRYAFTERKVCHFIGKHLLSKQPKDHKWPAQQFLASWRESLPQLFEPALYMLEGDCLIDEDTHGTKYLIYFPKTKLPFEPKARLAELFRVRHRWTAQELDPYVNDLAPDKKRLDALLLKYTRVQKIGNLVVYTSRLMG